jgi:hypothetical protein
VFQELSPFSRLEMLEQINGNRFYLVTTPTYQVIAASYEEVVLAR